MTRRDYASEATAYASGVVSGDIPAAQITAASCQRHLDDLGRDWRYRFDPERAYHACKFVELLPHVKGDLASRRELIRLEPWQVFIVSSIFGWVDRDTQLRRYRTAYIEVARKNAKSTLASGIALYMLAADGEAGAEVYSCATTRDQARIVWADARQMCDRTRGLRRRYGIDVRAHAIHVPAEHSIFRPLSRDTGGNLDGLNTHCAIVDELHAHKTRELFDVIDTSTGARSQPLILVITTAGFDQSGICYEKRLYTGSVVKQEVEDPTWFGLIYTVDDELLDQDEVLLTDQNIWQMANPNLGVSVSRDDLERKARQALATPAARANYLTKHLNVWTRSASGWLDMVAWDQCADPELSIDDYTGMPCWVAADLANKRDIASVAIVFRRRDGDGLVAYARHYVNAAAAADTKNSQYSGWAKTGRIIVTPGDVTDYTVIEHDLREIAETYDVQTLALDPWQAEQMRQRLHAAGVNAVELKQSKSYISPAAKALDELILTRKLRHEGCPVLRWMAGNVIVKPDPLENIYPLKARPENKIDGVVALIMAVGLATAEAGDSLDGGEVIIL